MVDETVTQDTGIYDQLGRYTDCEGANHLRMNVATTTLNDNVMH